jgi:LPS export ABC transporter permease LptF/LPS export ABC transporter permease LptG
MRLIDRYICREVFSHALLGLAIFTFVFFVPRLVQLMSLVVRPSASTGSVLLLIACSLPPVLIFSLPAAVLVGVLIGLGRLSADSELIALNAVGIGRRRLLLPVGALALGTGALTLLITLWLGPAGLRTLQRLEQRLRASQASFEIQPRVFEEGFPQLVLYVQDVEAAATRWHGVFLAEMNPAIGSQLTLAKDAIVIADREQGKLQLHLGDGSTHAYDPRDPNRYSVTTFAASDLPIGMGETASHTQAQPAIPARALGALLADRGPDWREARVELHRRLAFPFACLVFALVAVPIAARPRRGGRAMGFILTLLLLSGYYLLFVAGVGKARQGALSPWAGVWVANICTALTGLLLLLRTDEVGGGGRLAEWTEALSAWRHRRPTLAAGVENGPAPMGTAPLALHSRLGRAAGFPLLLDLHLLRSFLFYFALMLAGFVVLFEAFTFFELLDDITRNHIEFGVVANYFRYLVPLMLYQLAPLAALVATLATLGVMSKNNEITAFKASGISLYRLALPLLVAGGLLAGALFLLDYTFLPYANQRQDALRNQIKGRPAQTFYQPRHQWIFGEGTKIYNYEVFDPDRDLFGGLNVFELDPGSFQLRRRVFAARARWEPSLHSWVLEQGWVRDFDGATITRFLPFDAYSLAELDEPPIYFKREVRQSYQMNPRELRQYIHELQQTGFDAARLTVQWHKKLAFPLIAPIVILLGVPFAFLVGTRGAVSGLALAVGIAIVYWAVAALFEAMGAVGQLPPGLAGWAPDAIFAFVGIYFFLKMDT